MLELGGASLHAWRQHGQGSMLTLLTLQEQFVALKQKQLHLWSKNGLRNMAYSTTFPATKGTVPQLEVFDHDETS